MSLVEKGYKQVSYLLTFLSEWAGWIFGFFAAAFAIRGSVNLNVGEIKRENRLSKTENLRALCPHVIVQPLDNGTTLFRKAFFNASKNNITNNYFVCELCGYKTNDSNEPYRWTTYWTSNPNIWRERNEKIKQLEKKLGRQ